MLIQLLNYRLYLNFTCFSTNVIFLYQNSLQDTSLHSVILSSSILCYVTIFKSFHDLDDFGSFEKY